MKPSVYIESTVISYLTSRPSRDLIVVAHQQITVEEINAILDLKTPVMCTPEELIEV